MAPIIEEFWASAQARAHMLAKHGIDCEEALEAAESTARHYRTWSGVQADRRYVIPGKTEAGRRVWVLYDDEGEGRGRIVTAREAVGRQDLARHRRLRGD